MNAVQIHPSAGEGRLAVDNRLVEQAAWIKSRLDTLQPNALEHLEETLEIEPEEAIVYLEGQARAAAKEILTSDEALTIYQAVTPAGWEPGTRLEMKMTITTLMGRLLYA